MGYRRVHSREYKGYYMSYDHFRNATMVYKYVKGVREFQFSADNEYEAMTEIDDIVSKTEENK